MNYKFGNAKKTARRNQKICNAIFPLLGLFAIVAMIAGASSDSSGLVAGGAMCFGPMGFIPRGPLMDEFDDGQGGGGASTKALPEKEFQQRVIGAIKKTGEQHKEIETKLGEIDAESKKLTEDFAEQAKTFDGFGSDVMKLTQTMRKMTLKIESEKRSSFGSPIDRITGDIEMRMTVNAIIRGALRQGGNTRVAMNDDHVEAFKSFNSKAVSTDASPGSTYMKDDLLTEIYSLIATYGIWRDFDVVPASTKTTKLLVDDTDPDMLVVGEGAAPAEASYTGSTVSAEVKKLLGWLSITSEALEDSEIDLSAFILPKFANATAKRLDYFGLAADGTDDATNGAFTGIFEGGVASVATAGRVTVGALKLDDFIKATLSVDASVLENPNTRWTMHPFQLMRCLGVKDDNGRSIFLPSTDAPSFGAFGSILGFPVRLAHAAPSAEAVNAKIASFGDPKGMAILLRKDLQIAVSEEAKFLEDKTVFRARARAAAKLKKAESNAVLTLPGA